MSSHDDDAGSFGNDSFVEIFVVVPRGARARSKSAQVNTTTDDVDGVNYGNAGNYFAQSKDQ